MLGLRAVPWESARNTLSRLRKSVVKSRAMREFSLSGKMVTEI